MSRAKKKYFGQVPKWPTGADCKSAGSAFEGSNPSLPTRVVCKVESYKVKRKNNFRLDDFITLKIL